MSIQKLNEAYANWKQQPTSANMMHALQASQPIIDMAVKTYVGQGDPVAASHAKILALRALRSYDAKRGTQLRTHMLTQLQPLRRLAAKRRFITKVPEQVQYDMSGIREAESELADELGRDPTEAELADRTGLSMRRLAHVRKLVIPQAESSLGDEHQLEVDTPSTMKDWQDYVYYDLSPTDQKIFEWRTGYNSQPILGVSEVAKRLNLSAGRVTQRANNIAMKLEEGLTLER